MKPEQLRNNISAYIAGLSMGGDNETVTNAIMRDVSRLTAALSDQVVVPREPTPEMAAAGRKALAVVADRMEEAKLLAVSSIDFWQRVGHEPANEIYKAMLAANAPPPQPSEDNGPDTNGGES